MDTITITEQRVAVLYGRLWTRSSNPEHIIAEFDHLLELFDSEQREALRLMFEVGRTMFPHD